MSYKLNIINKYKSSNGFAYRLRCNNCNCVFNLCAYLVEKKNNGRFCSMKCLNRFQKKHPHTKFLLGITGKNHPGWRGGKHTNSGGYILIRKPEHPNTNCNGYILEHRYVMSKSLGRPLAKGERVHHKNGNKIDNRIKNLKLFPKPGEHFKKYHGEFWGKRVGKDPITGRFISKH